MRGSKLFVAKLACIQRTIEIEISRVPWFEHPVDGVRPLIYMTDVTRLRTLSL